jgi:hypothetical protein
MKPLYAKIMFYCLLEYATKNPSNPKMLFISSLESSFEAIKLKLGAEVTSSKYAFFSRVKDAFEKNVGHLNFYMEEYGLDYDRTSQALLINDSSKFESILDIYRKI